MQPTVISGGGLVNGLALSGIVDQVAFPATGQEPVLPDNALSSFVPIDTRTSESLFPVQLSAASLSRFSSPLSGAGSVNGNNGGGDGDDPKTKQEGFQPMSTRSIYTEVMSAEHVVGGFEISSYHGDFSPVYVELESIQAELAIGRQMIDAGQKEAPSGVLISGHQRKDFERYAEKNGSVFLGRQSEEPLGYIITVDGDLFAQKYFKARILQAYENSELHDLILSGNYVYLDQIGVRWNAHKTGLAYQLLAAFEKHYSHRDKVVLVMTDPINNTRSLSFFQKNGYRMVSRVLFPRFGTIDNFIGFVLYKP